MDNKGKFAKELSIGAVIGGVILLVILFNVISVAVPLVGTAGDTINATSLPFASFFASDGIILLAIMGAVLLAIVGYLGFKATKR